MPDPREERLRSRWKHLLVRVQADNGRKPVRVIASALGLSPKSIGRVSDLLNGRRWPVDVKQARNLVKELGGGAEEISEAAEILSQLAHLNVRRRQDAGPVRVSAGATLMERLRAVPGAQQLIDLLPVDAHAERLKVYAAGLLGAAAADLTEVETALLVLAAHFHDRRPPDGLRCDDVPLNGVLAAVCAGLRVPMEELRGEDLKPRSAIDADLRFCVTILRLAELFDISDSRSPDEVCAHVGYLPPIPYEPEGTLTQVAWLPFPARRTPGYTVAISARSDHPAAEYRLRTYLEAVETEMLRCQSLQGQFLPSTARVVLPGKIADDHIESAGYRYGRFRFEIDRQAVLELFTGESLYEVPYVFVRELLQNAYDATRLRQVLRGSYADDKIEVKCWRDEIGYLWVEFDDVGAGMTENVLVDYFLGVGKSYYRSAELLSRLDRLGGRAEQFGSIGRFGIGALTCLMVADRVEVSTKGYRDDGAEAPAIRLSIQQRSDFFVLREDSARSAIGTSIVMRVDPSQSTITSEGIGEALRRYVFCAPVPVEFNGEPVEGVSNDVVDRPLLPETRIIDLGLGDRDHSDQDEPPYCGPLRIVLSPLDLTRYSATPMMRGQLLACGTLTTIATADEAGGSPRDLLAGVPTRFSRLEAHEARDLLRDSVTAFECAPHWSTWRGHGLSLDLKISRVVSREALVEAAQRLLGAGVRGARRMWHPGLSRPMSEAELLGLVETLLDEEDDQTDRRTSAVLSTSVVLSVRWQSIGTRDEQKRLASTWGWWGHNGVALPTELAIHLRDRFRRNDFNLLLDLPDWVLVGGIALSDQLRPEVSVSRDQIRAVPFAVHSAIQLAFRRAVRAELNKPDSHYLDPLLNRNLIEMAPGGIFTATATGDPLVMSGAWDDEPVLPLKGEGVASVRELKQTPAQLIRLLPHPDWYKQEVGASTDRLAFSFDDVMVLALAHHRLNLTDPPKEKRDDSYDEDDESYDDLVDKYYASGPVLFDDQLPERPQAAADFPPMTFLPHALAPDLLRAESGPWNLRHPLIAWVVEHAETLAARLPVAYQELRKVLSNDDSGYYEVRAVVDKVTSMHPDLRG